MPSVSIDSLPENTLVPFHNDTWWLAVCGRFYQGKIHHLNFSDGHCHRHASDYFFDQIDAEPHRKLELITGYAFFEGKWYRHSFLLHDSVIIEPTDNHYERYFGIPLSSDESGQDRWPNAWNWTELHGC